LAKKIYKYDVAISFAEEDRHVASQIVLALEIKRFKKVYYYPNDRAATWGKGMEKKLQSIYSTEAKVAVVLLSKHYFDKEKIYTLIEFSAIKARMNMDEKITYMLPVILGKKEDFEEHINLGDGYIPWKNNPKRVAAELIKCLMKPYHKTGVRINIKM